MTGSDIPTSLPDEVRNEIQHVVAIVQGQSQQQQSVIPSAQSSVPTQPTSMYANLQAPMMTGVMPMSAGGPQVSMPTGMLGNTMDFTNRMMPHNADYAVPAGFESLSKNIKIPWAVTSEEKKQYSKIFKAWDTEKKGTLSGETAKEIFSQSGLPQNILMQIW